TKVTSTSLPRVLANRKGFPFWSVSLKSATATLTARRPISLGSLGGSGMCARATPGGNAPASARAKIHRSIFDFKLIGHAKNFGAIGQIAADHIGAVENLLFAGAKPHRKEQSAFHQVQISADIFRIDP